ncbi:MAG: hypothetical protein ACP5DX_01705 [Paracoccaceae bacterium]
MKRYGFSALVLASLAACSPEVPDSAAGVGFGDYGTYQAAREQTLQGDPVTVQPLGAEAPLDTAASGLPAAEAPAAAETGTADAATAEAVPNNPGLSDEQDFKAVTARETIESDRERLAALRQQYEFIEPEALPDRAPSTGPNIVAYALSTTNRVGEQVYRRSGLKLSSSQRACARYASPDLAQQAFLEAGGPQRDRKNLDPDGDGFACAWDPRPFRLARR